MNLSQLRSILASEPTFRFKQVEEAIFKNLIEDWDEAKTLPKPLRETLKKTCPLTIPALLQTSKDKSTYKALLTLEDGLKIETVLMRHTNKNAEQTRNSVCVSSQVGCPMACTFCDTGKMGFIRNLSTDEILMQVLFFERLLKKEGQKVNNLTYMGMGEPFMNYESVLESIRLINSTKTFNIGARHISISTCGVIDGIDRLSNENLEVNLAISLHAPNDELRTKLMPSNRKYPLQEILKAVDRYVSKTNRKVMFEYLLIKDVNDTLKNAEELSKFMSKHLYMVNLIPYNPTEVYKPSPTSQIKLFRAFLESKGVSVTQRYRYGVDIDAACGQLATKNNHRHTNS